MMTKRKQFVFGSSLSLLLIFSACLCAVASKRAEGLSRSRRAAVPSGPQDPSAGPNGTNSSSTPSCESVKQFFAVKNVTVNLDTTSGNKGTICGGQCCSAEMEDALRMQGQKDFADLLRHNSRSIQGLLNSTATTLQNHVVELTSQSENKTLQILAKIFGKMSALSREPTALFYGDIRRYVQINDTNPVNMKTSVTRFFTDLFPLIYHHVSKLQAKDFSPEYKTCLKQTIDEVQPFGDIPVQLTLSLTKSLEATRLLLQAFDIGIVVLNTTDTLLTKESVGASGGNIECHRALTKMTHCPKCIGLGVGAKPCSGYCLNVLRGCLTKYVVELDQPWNSYVEAVERLVIAVKQLNNEVGVNADSVIRQLDTRISEAIMRAMEKIHEIDVKVKRACGPVKFSSNNDPLMEDSEAMSALGKRNAANLRISANPLTNFFQQFLNSIGKSKGFYGNLADSLCRDDSFANQKDQHCWNGERIGEYSKTVVDAGLSMQKYNPEVQPSTTLQTLDPQVATLADKLRHVHQMLVTSLGITSNLPESDNYMQSDSADGSGSGGGPDFSDDSDDIDNRSGSGSGHGPIVTSNRPGKVPTTYGGASGGQEPTGTNRKQHNPEVHTTKYDSAETPKSDGGTSGSVSLSLLGTTWYMHCLIVMVVARSSLLQSFCSA